MTLVAGELDDVAIDPHEVLVEQLLEVTVEAARLAGAQGLADILADVQILWCAR